ncbi:hypothetical protein P5673_005197 [Acropora cervicornis]|uniref:Uncharacterized protein n=1 Tax=Acropora cervicornis TaxID=6130 RepID=A0AAD9VDC6_ACRCE|nr:hypothetical protein P5673_005197 [Acropora cervicornis]
MMYSAFKLRFEPYLFLLTDKMTTEFGNSPFLPHVPMSFPRGVKVKSRRPDIVANSETHAPVRSKTLILLPNCWYTSRQQFIGSAAMRRG